MLADMYWYKNIAIYQFSTNIGNYLKKCILSKLF